MNPMKINQFDDWSRRVINELLLLRCCLTVRSRQLSSIWRRVLGWGDVLIAQDTLLSWMVKNLPALKMIGTGIHLLLHRCLATLLRLKIGLTRLLHLVEAGLTRTDDS